MASLMNIPVLGFVENMSYFECPDCNKRHSIFGDSHIDEIAEEFGYENESKFSAAFKRIMGDTPGVYRKEHTKVKII